MPFVNQIPVLFEGVGAVAARSAARGLRFYGGLEEPLKLTEQQFVFFKFYLTKPVMAMHHLDIADLTL